MGLNGALVPEPHPSYRTRPLPAPMPPHLHDVLQHHKVRLLILTHQGLQQLIHGVQSLCAEQRRNHSKWRYPARPRTNALACDTPQATAAPAIPAHPLTCTRRGPTANSSWQQDPTRFCCPQGGHCTQSNALEESGRTPHLRGRGDFQPSFTSPGLCASQAADLRPVPPAMHWG